MSSWVAVCRVSYTKSLDFEFQLQGKLTVVAAVACVRRPGAKIEKVKVQNYLACRYPLQRSSVLYNGADSILDNKCCALGIGYASAIVWSLTAR